MTKRGSYHGGSTIIGWSGVPTPSTRKQRGGPGLLAAEVRAHEPTTQRSEHMPPPGPAPTPRATSPKAPRKRTPISAAQLVHFSFGGRSKDRVLDDLEPMVWKLAENGFRKPADVARMLNKQGIKTACGERWTSQLAWFLLDFLFARRRQRKVASPPTALHQPASTPLASKQPLTAEEIKRRLSGFGRIVRSD